MPENLKKNPEDGTADEFKKCLKGHIFEAELEDCPYCGGKKIEEELAKLVIRNPALKKKLEDMAMCYITGPKDF